MPTAAPRPWPSGPVVVSTPGVMKHSGWPGVFDSSWRKRLQLVDRDALDAGEVQERVEQHRAVAGGQHEAVAVGPARIGGVVFQELREQHRGDVGGAHRQPGMAGFRLLDRVHGERPQGVREIRMGDASGGGFGHERFQKGRRARARGGARPRSPAC